jgi:cyclohexanone monooxygenase
LEKLAGLRVGLIGTGASGCQSTLPLSEAAGHLTVFQRTPPQVFAEPNTPIDKDAVAQLEAGWSTRLRTNFDLVVGGSTGVGDRNESDLFENFNRLVESSAIELNAVGGARRVGLRDLRRVNAKNSAEILSALHRDIDATVKDKQLAEALKPYYHLGCKRPVLHPGYLPAFNRPNVQLISSGIRKLTENGAVADSGEFIPLDVIVFATGFEPGNLSIYNKIVGENGVAFEDKVGCSIASTIESSTYLGIHSRGFPNLMIMQGPQCVRPFNMTSLLEQQSMYFARVVEHCRSHAIEKFQPTEDAEKRWVQNVCDSQADDGGFLDNCTPGWYNNHGQVDDIKKSSMAYGAGPQAYYSILSKVRFEEDFESMGGGTCKL